MMTNINVEAGTADKMDMEDSLVRAYVLARETALVTTDKKAKLAFVRIASLIEYALDLAGSTITA